MSPRLLKAVIKLSYQSSLLFLRKVPITLLRAIAQHNTVFGQDFLDARIFAPHKTKQMGTRRNNQLNIISKSKSMRIRKSVRSTFASLPFGPLILTSFLTSASFVCAALLMGYIFSYLNWSNYVDLSYPLTPILIWISYGAISVAIFEKWHSHIRITKDILWALVFCLWITGMLTISVLTQRLWVSACPAIMVMIAVGVFSKDRRYWRY